MTTYVVVDIEADGPIPGSYSMISLGAVAASVENGLVAEFEINLEPLASASTHPATMHWFNTEAPRALAYARANPVAPGLAVHRFLEWARGLAEPRVLAACPSPFDFMWLNWYLHEFAGDELKPPTLDPVFTSSALDIATLYAAQNGIPFHEMRTSRIPDSYLDGHAHTHLAIDDARGYACALLHLLRGDLTPELARSAVGVVASRSLK